MTNPSAHTREALEELKVELQLNELQSRWLETKLEALIASEVQAAVQDVIGSDEPEVSSVSVLVPYSRNVLRAEQRKRAAKYKPMVK